MYVLEGPPVPLARARHGRGFTYDPQKNLKLLLQLKLKAQHTGPLITTAIRLSITFFMPIPATRRRKRSSISGHPHCSKPDVDNLLKLVSDIGTGIIWKDDALIWSIYVQKIYDDNPRTEIHIEGKGF